MTSPNARARQLRRESLEAAELELLRDFYGHWMQMHKAARENDVPRATRHAQSLIDLSLDIERLYVADEVIQ